MKTVGDDDDDDVGGGRASGSCPVGGGNYAVK